MGERKGSQRNSTTDIQVMVSVKRPEGSLE